MSNKKTIILISRGMRTANLFKEAAIDLSQDYDVTVFADKNELKFWSDAKNIDLRDSQKEFNNALKQLGQNLMSLASQIEKELGLPLFKAASHFLLYRKFTKRSLSRWKMPIVDNEEALLRNYVGSYLVFSQFFKNNPPALIFYEAPELVSSRIASALACKNNVFSLGFRAAPHVWDGKPRMWLTYGWYERNVLLEYYYNNKNLLTPESYLKGGKLVQNMKEKYKYPILQKRFITQAEGFTNWRRLAPSILSKLAYGLLSLQPRKYIRLIYNIMWLNKHFHHGLPKEPFIAFFMHHQPESTTSCQIPRWVNQDVVIEQLAINAPYGLKILVKEHARNLGYRGKEYFKELLNLHNIYFCYPTVDTYSIISNAKAILVLTGTAGFEGLLMGKKVAVLGRPYYSIFEGVKKLNYPEEIFDALNDPSWNPQGLEQERNTFAAAYAQSLYDFGSGKWGKPIPDTGGDKWANAIRDFLRKKDEFNLKPDMFEKGY